MDKKNVESRKSTPLTMKDYTVYKEFSPEMVMSVSHLYSEGYFKDSDLLLRRRLDVTFFENSYARDFAKYATEQFGRDHQDIANMEDHVYKVLSPDMVMFVQHLYDEVYFKDSSFLPRKRFDIACFENSYPCNFVKYGAKQFGRDC
ncbi:hypothetical protein HAX54_047000 [Datura stramonium]|uniref:Uncharacterized protein n=1 Tax=Datura stramonium TaxID=4076 RepID=A0ABS8RQ14_DATST|nr:hypothetical protein [Datura stramonium]